MLIFFPNFDFFIIEFYYSLLLSGYIHLINQETQPSIFTYFFLFWTNLFGSCNSMYFKYLQTYFYIL